MRREPVRLGFFAWPRGGGESVIAVELADDSDDSVNGLEVRSLCSGVHRAERHEQRFVETADLKREEFGWRLRHPLREDLANYIAHPLERKTLAGRDLRHRSAAIEETDDPLFTLGPFRAAWLFVSVMTRPGERGRQTKRRDWILRLALGTNIEQRSPFDKKMSS
jgi:hypothetical protein